MIIFCLSTLSLLQRGNICAHQLEWSYAHRHRAAACWDTMRCSSAFTRALTMTSASTHAMNTDREETAVFARKRRQAAPVGIASSLVTSSCSHSCTCTTPSSVRATYLTTQLQSSDGATCVCISSEIHNKDKRHNACAPCSVDARTCGATREQQTHSRRGRDVHVHSLSRRRSSRNCCNDRRCMQDARWARVHADHSLPPL